MWKINLIRSRVLCGIAAAIHCLLLPGVCSANPTQSECYDIYNANAALIEQSYQNTLTAADDEYNECLIPHAATRDSSIADAQTSRNAAESAAFIIYDGAILYCQTTLIIALVNAAALPDPGIAEAIAFLNYTSCMTSAYSLYVAALAFAAVDYDIGVTNAWDAYYVGQGTCLDEYLEDVQDANQSRDLLNSINLDWLNLCLAQAPD